MNSNDTAFLATLAQPVARFTAEQVALTLNCQVYDVPILVNGGLLSPLGKPRANSTKYFSSVDVLEKGRDPKWLHKMTLTLGRHWQAKNAKAKVTRAEREAFSASEEHLMPWREAS